jgi:hypothetical protein
MAMINRNTLVLNRVSVVRDVVTGTMVNGVNPAKSQAPVTPFSMRPPSQRYPQAVQETGLRYGHADHLGLDHAAERAGRPGSSGVLASRSPAPSARRIIALRWSIMGGSCPTAAWRFSRFTARLQASVGDVLPGRSLALRAHPVIAGQRLSLPRLGRARKHATAKSGWLQPAGGALLASTRG